MTKKQCVGWSAVLIWCWVSMAGCALSSPPPAAAIGSSMDSGHWTGEVMTEAESRYHPVVGTRGMVVADDREAAEWGVEIMRRGGNAIDAAVATAFAMAVTRPHYASLGGGGFMVYCPKPEKGKPQPCQSLDYREEAPSAATRDMYVHDGKAHTELSQNGALASGVPGVTAGLLAALEKFGTLPRHKILSRPIVLARDGFLFSSHGEVAAQDRWTHMNGETRRIFGCDEKGIPWQDKPSRKGVPKAPCAPQTRIKQHDLARVLEVIDKKGAPGFYEGPVAQKIVEGLKASHGIMSLEDLKSYKPIWREPLYGKFKGMEIVSMPPPSAGGAGLLMMLGYMQRAAAAGALSQGYGAAQTVHAIAHGMALAFADRAEYFGDPGFWKVPLDTLLSAPYLDSRWQTFDSSRAHLPEKAGDLRIEGSHTTHFSVIDREGNAVAITTTVNDNFGSGFTPPSTGVVMNNEMDDFSIQPGTPNLFGLVGTEANAIAPHKRPLSSMSPTIVRDAQGNARIVIGAAGGPRITTSVFLSIFNRFQFGMSLTDAVAASRLHQQWRPAAIKLERYGFSTDTRRRLVEMGYSLEDVTASAKVHALERFPNGRVWGAPDFRGEGAAVAE
ncbi:gamma-glutamyltransferase [Bdellovibrionota bacterium FG-1]